LYHLIQLPTLSLNLSLFYNWEFVFPYLSSLQFNRIVQTKVIERPVLKELSVSI
jgi:hypothetical protein